MITKVSARDWKFAINNGTYATPEWVDTSCGLNTFTFSQSKEDGDTSDFCTDGWASHIVTSRGAEISAEGFYMEDPKTGDRALGQTLIEAAALKMSYDSLADFKLTSPGGLAKRFYASVLIGDIGGGTADSTTWGFTLTVSGKPITM